MLFRMLLVGGMILLGGAQASAQLLTLPWNKDKLEVLAPKLCGTILDFTRNHGADRRIYSPSLKSKRDLYVYLPPGYDGQKQFPFAIMLHGIGHDEHSFLDLAEHFDDEIRHGRLPAMVIAAPDGSIRGRAMLLNNGSFYLNSRAGCFDDYIAYDVWNFMLQNFAIRPERDAHVIAGASMGGFGAYNIAFKHPEKFAHIVGIMPPMNLRYADCHGRYFANFDPNCVMFRDPVRRQLLVGRFYGVIHVRTRHLVDPLVGRWFPRTTEFISTHNPIEMLQTYNVQPGQFNMFLGYGTEDEFNIDAQVEHFVYVARQRGINPTVVVIPGGHHNAKTGFAMIPELSKWTTERLKAYVPAGYQAPHSPCGACGGVVLRPLSLPMGLERFPGMVELIEHRSVIPAEGMGD